MYLISPILVICCVSTFLFEYCHGAVFTPEELDGFTQTDLKKLSLPIIIGSQKFDSVDSNNQNSRERKFYNNAALPKPDSENPSYPSGIDNPFFRTADIFNQYNINENNTDLKQKLKKILGDNQIIHTEKALLSFQPGPNSMFVIFIWNETETYLMILCDKPETLSRYKVAFLHRPGHAVFSIASEEPTEYSKQIYLFIYKISSESIERKDCLKNTNHISYNLISLTSYVSAVRGYVTTQKPCKCEKVVSKIFRNNLPYQESENIIVDTSGSDLKYSLPLLWDPGMYQVKMTCDEMFNYITNLETFNNILQKPDKNANLIWEERIQMNNYLFSLSVITLQMPNADKFYLYILTSDNWERVGNIQFQSSEVKCEGSKTEKCLADLNSLSENMTFDVKKSIGLFVATIGNRFEFSKPFTLIWLKAFFINHKGHANVFTENLCESFMADKKPLKQPVCPENSILASSLLSTFRLSENGISFEKEKFYSVICYDEIVTSSTRNGVTCCYSKESKFLVYGSDFYKRPEKIAASYTWTISPSRNAIGHFLTDRLPILSCCSFIGNKQLCSKLWNFNHRIKIAKPEKDLRADVFGDPHIIPFNYSTPFSYLYAGEFVLIENALKDFVVQGRFYSTAAATTTLKAISVKIQNQIFTIEPFDNSNLNTKWKIMKNSDQIYSLPFYEEDVNIIQSDDRNTNLIMYINMPDQKNAYIKLERFCWNTEPFEHMNMKIHLSNNFQNVVNGSFGIEEYMSNSFQLSSLGLMSMDIWKIKIKSNSIFYYSKESDFEIIKNKILTNPSKMNENQECENNTFCNFDYSQFNTIKLHLSTLMAFKDRVNIENQVASGLSYKRACNLPDFNDVYYNSTNYSEGSTIMVTECMDPVLKLKTLNQTLRCIRNDTDDLIWSFTTNDDKIICRKPEIPEDNNTIYIASGVAGAVILIIILCLALIIIVKYKKHQKRDPVFEDLHTSEKELNDVYDNWQANNLANEDIYSTYAAVHKTIEDHTYKQIQKPETKSEGTTNF